MLLSSPVPYLPTVHGSHFGHCKVPNSPHVLQRVQTSLPYCSFWFLYMKTCLGLLNVYKFSYLELSSNYQRDTEGRKVLYYPQGRGSFPSIWHWWGHTWSPASSSGLLSARETWTYWSQSCEGPQRWWRDCSTSPMRNGWESWDCLA